MTAETHLWEVAGSGPTLLAAAIVWLAPMLLAGFVTWTSETLRAISRPASPPAAPRAPLGGRPATSTVP